MFNDDYKMPPQVDTDEELFNRLNKMTEEQVILEIAKYRKLKREAKVKHVRIAHRLRKAITEVSLVERYGTFNRRLIANYITAVQEEIDDLQQEECNVKE